MKRYEILLEETKVGRKVEKQYAVYDNLEQRVVVRYQHEKDAEKLLANYELAVGQ